MPSLGGVVMNSQLMTPIPLYIIKPRMANKMSTTLRLSNRNRPKATCCETRFLSMTQISYFCLDDTASTVKLINKLIKNNTTPSRNSAW